MAKLDGVSLHRPANTASSSYCRFICLAADYSGYHLYSESELKKLRCGGTTRADSRLNELCGRALTAVGARGVVFRVFQWGSPMFQYRNILCLILTCVLAGCSAASGIQSTQTAEIRDSYASMAPSRGSDGPYILGPGDRVNIKVYSDPDMSGQYEINSSGAVALPLVGDIEAVGLTTRQLEQAIAARMKGKVANAPQVSVEIASYAPFYVYGEVKKAGEYQYHIGLTVADAIATAGGLTYRADEHHIFLRRGGSSAEHVVTLDVPVKIYPGDNIRVAESFF